MGLKLWGSEPLTSADLNNYLMKQAVIACTSGTRPSSPQDGMMIYETDTKYYRTYSSALGLWLVDGQNGLATSTPNLTATTTNPGLGTSPTKRGKLTRSPGGMVHYAWKIAWGTTGSPTAGSGQYLIDLPIAAAIDFGGTDPEWWGQGRVTNTGTTTYTATFYIPGSNPSVVSALIGGGVWSNSSPFTWSNVGVETSGSITYRAAAGS